MLTLGGDHSIALGTLAGVLRARPNSRVLWVDAHADINSPEGSPSGNMHGMSKIVPPRTWAATWGRSTCAFEMVLVWGQVILKVELASFTKSLWQGKLLYPHSNQGGYVFPGES